jgi:hypothetical protein
MFNTHHSLPSHPHRDHPIAWFAAPVITVLAAIVVFTMLPHERGAAEAKPAETAAPAPQPGSDSAGLPAGWFSSTEPLPNVQD